MNKTSQCPASNACKTEYSVKQKLGSAAAVLMAKLLIIIFVLGFSFFGYREAMAQYLGNDSFYLSSTNGSEEVPYYTWCRSRDDTDHLLVYSAEKKSISRFSPITHESKTISLSALRAVIGVYCLKDGEKALVLSLSADGMDGILSAVDFDQGTATELYMEFKAHRSEHLVLLSTSDQVGPNVAWCCYESKAVPASPYDATDKEYGLRHIYALGWRDQNCPIQDDSVAMGLYDDGSAIIQANCDIWSQVAVENKDLNQLVLTKLKRLSDWLSINSMLRQRVGSGVEIVTSEEQIIGISTPGNLIQALLKNPDHNQTLMLIRCVGSVPLDSQTQLICAHPLRLPDPFHVISFRYLTDGHAIVDGRLDGKHCLFDVRPAGAKCLKSFDEYDASLDDDSPALAAGYAISSDSKWLAVITYLPAAKPEEMLQGQKKSPLVVLQVLPLLSE